MNRKLLEIRSTDHKYLQEAEDDKGFDNRVHYFQNPLPQLKLDFQ